LGDNQGLDGKTVVDVRDLSATFETDIDAHRARDAEDLERS
jgi:hypothetical protein